MEKKNTAQTKIKTLKWNIRISRKKGSISEWNGYRVWDSDMIFISKEKNPMFSFKESNFKNVI
ncbi:hypothetical protein LEP1GSC193_3056 [Leptospira alstonii serovar Pingchang str. 80-412]|uniref:Uncharacterized protein n=2 Tax=Leptospira alstonii TaxID=28452 RepID=M6CMC6_9LEPT|nr:hypothetical protein LEP1GSC194_4084 [Leptospira alstonii serovar Sichuan str. 79601]EQA79642.1 hypothetical protein LEP1GSC193_3056 [Leptospira alstonii serovar Pingchang str. 80-412]